MKNLKYLILILAGFVAFISCTDEVSEIQPAGNPVMEVESTFSNVHFGDVLPFTVNVSDEISLSTLTAILYFGDEEVERTTIRTKENGEYSGTIEIPFHKDIPNGTATLEFVLLNTTMKSTTQTFDVPITRAQYPYLILVTENASYPMLPTGTANEYAATEAFPSTDLPAYIKTPVLDEKGTEIVFGWDAGAVIEGTTTNIPFVSPVAGTFAVTFNTLTYEAAPFFEILLNGVKMNMVDKENYQIDVDLTQGQDVTVEGLENIADWWIDADYLTKKEDGLYTFVPITGKYRISANLKLNYFRVEVLSGNSVASLNADGTGAIWVIGDNLGKPSLQDNYLGWNTDKALCMAPVSAKKYQLTVVGGETVSTDGINFKFFHQKGWGGEFGSAAISTTSEIVFIGDGTNGRDNGNLGLVSGVTLEEGATYVFTVDVTAGIEQAVLTVTKK
ncbi:DUF5125 domain-containing protein [Maribellus sp. YY47]|uniref:DUF5121 domain-containing protein n=1 Tax=Maribellus sp. YY47 TaxID=2929486 RepID=UPI0020019C9E|nr:DUF5125 domain-containing protein [Maribellus sp. YY47]MCK3685356.1 DUF5125 domain-containing protein [Maribellus sp. YY47]